MGDFDIPRGLSVEGQNAARIIVTVLKRFDALDSYGVRVFYTPKEWAKKPRGREFKCGGRGSLLIVVHGEGMHDPFFDMGSDAYAFMSEALSRFGMYIDSCAPWFSAINSR